MGYLTIMMKGISAQQDPGICPPTNLFLPLGKNFKNNGRSILLLLLLLFYIIIA